MPEIDDRPRSGGSFFALEFNLSSGLHENIDHPFRIGAFGYAASVNDCMTTTLPSGRPPCAREAADSTHGTLST